tara:strand:- start:237 stop:770 length:534 start_codon:yes stop_codon:yes gene_type:complete
MKNNLLIYSSVDGQTKKICERIIDSSLSKESFEMVKIEDADSININNFLQIIVGASIRYGKHNKKVLSFIKKHKNLLDTKNTAFFSVNVVARKKDKNTPYTNPYVLKFLKKTNWQPNKTAVFAGRIDYPKYNFIDKHIIRLIMFITSGPTDLTQSYEFTDWNSVDKFAKEISNTSDY